jgi:hypothetical protein
MRVCRAFTSLRILALSAEDGNAAVRDALQHHAF